MSTKMLKPDPRDLRVYADAGMSLIPLHQPHSIRRSKGAVVKLGKVPRDRDWPHRAYSLKQMELHMTKEGGNVGVLLGPDHVVVDVDPRNFKAGVNSLQKLVKDFNIKLKECPHILTGSGGDHFFFKKPENILIGRKLPGYPGIDFLSRGSQVVAAGSVHPDTGRHYRFDTVTPPLDCAPNIPASLLASLSRSGATPAAIEPGNLDNAKLAELLAVLDPTSYREYGAWFALMAASHQATGGLGREAFLAWSTSDPTYADHSDKIALKWDSLRANRVGGITIATLYKEVINAGRADLLSHWPTVEEDFGTSAPMVTDQREWLREQYVWVAKINAFVDRVTLERLDPDQFNSLYAHLAPEKKALLTQVWLGHVVRRFKSVTFQPNKGELLGDRYNLWRERGVKAFPGDVAWFLDHLEYLVPDEKERGYLLDFLAHVVQRRGDKIQFALLIYGRQGIGKGFLGKLLRMMLGDENVSKPSNDELTSRFNSWQLQAELVIIDELMTLGRLEVMNRLKPVITEDTVRIEEKGKDVYTIENRFNVISFTNHPDALLLEHGDRRWLVVASTAKPRDQAHYEGLFARLETSNGASAVKDFLLKRDISKFESKGRAPLTQAHEDMRTASMSDPDLYLNELWETGSAPFDSDLVTMEDVIKALPDDLARRIRGRNQLFRRTMHTVGAIRAPRYTSGPPPHQRVWIIRNQDAWCRKGGAACLSAWRDHDRDKESWEEV